jgi:peroxisomal 2,4-dienoyl-CoA reductase
MAADIESARPGARVLGLGGVDVRDTLSLDKAVEKCVKELGSLDYVIAGAAGNFLAPIDQLSANAFKTVIEIDVIGSYNTLKATLLQLLKSATAHRLHSTTSEPLWGIMRIGIFVNDSHPRSWW